MKKRILSMLLVVTMLATMLVGCGGGSGNGGEAAAQELTFSITTDTTTMDTIQTSNLNDQRAAALVYEGLLRRELADNGDLILVEGVATNDYEVDETETIYTFHLREDAKFSDGSAVTADDVVYTYQRMFDPNLASPQSWQLEDMIVNAKAAFNGEVGIEEVGVKKIDDYTVEFTLNSPNPNFTTVITFPFARIISKNFVENCTGTFGSSVETTMGCGPYKLVAWEPGASLTYEPNEHYWNAENVHLTKVTCQIIAEASTLAQALMNNEVDVAALNDSDWNTLVDETGLYNVEEKAEMTTYFFLFNCASEKLSNPKIRLALSLGFDRERYNEEVYLGKYTPAYSFEPEVATVGDISYAEAAGDSAEYLKKLAEQYPDPKALLIEGMEEAGLGSDPSALTIKYTTLGTTEVAKKAAEWMKQELAANLGVNLEIELTETNIAYDLIDAGDFEMAFGGWGIDSGTEPWRFFRIFEPTAGYYGEAKLNWKGDKADEYSKYALEMQEIFDNERLLELYKLAEPILLEEAAVSPVYFSKLRMCVAKNVEGYSVHPFLLPDYIGVSLTEAE